MLHFIYSREPVQCFIIAFRAHSESARTHILDVFFDTENSILKVLIAIFLLLGLRLAREIRTLFRKGFVVSDVDYRVVLRA